MRTRSTIALLVLTTIVIVLLVRGDRWFSPTRVGEARKQNPMAFDSAKVDAIEIESAESTVLLHVKDHFWRVSKPIDDLADPDRVTALITALHDAQWIERVKRSDMPVAAWKMTGLEKPFAHLRLLSAGTVQAECWVGNAAAIEGAVYLDLPGRKGSHDTFVASTDLLTVLKKPVEDWRDEKLVRVPAESVSRIVIDGGNGSIELARSKPKAPWNLIKPFQTRGHNERINDLLGALLALKVTKTETEPMKQPLPADALKITLTTPAFGSPITVTLLKGSVAKPGTTEAIVSNRANPFTVASDRLDSLWMPFNDLRDDHLARVDSDTVDAIVVRGAGTSDVQLRKEGDHWLLQRHGQWEPASGERVARVFTALNEQLVKEFVADSAATLEPYGLQQPFLTVAWNDTGVVKSSTSVPGASKTFEAEPIMGINTTLLFGLDSQGNVFTKYEDEPFIYRVGASVLNALPRDGARWKALNPVRFTQFALKNITLSVGTNPSVSLDYDPITAEWKGKRAEQDLTPYLDRVKADRMAGKLSNLVVEDWVQDRSAAAKALATPAITVQITLLTEAGNVKSPTKLITINFAPTIPGSDAPLFYGRVNNEPDMFTITRATMLDAIKSVMKD